MFILVDNANVTLAFLTMWGKLQITSRCIGFIFYEKWYTFSQVQWKLGYREMFNQSNCDW